MTYLVTAPLVVITGPDGKVHHHYKGARIEIGASGHAAYLVDEGFVVKVDHPPALVAPVAEEAAVVEKPLHVAAKAKWIDYAVSQGVSREQAEAMTKEQLVASLK